MVSFRHLFPESIKLVKCTKIEVCNIYQKVNNLEVHNTNVYLYPMEEEYDFTTFYFIKYTSLDQESINKTATNLRFNKSMEK